MNVRLKDLIEFAQKENISDEIMIAVQENCVIGKDSPRKVFNPRYDVVEGVPVISLTISEF